MRIAGQLLLPGVESSPSCRLAPGAVTLAGDRIESVDIGEAAAAESADAGGPDAFVCPGLIDAHLHLPQFDSIGVAGLELLDWLSRVIYPAEARWEDPSYAADMTKRVARQLLSFGTTGVAAYATVHHAAAQAAIDVLGELGFSGHVGQVLMDREAPAELVRPAADLLRECAGLHASGRIAPSINPRFAVSCSAPLLDGCGRLAASTGRLVQTHLAETRRECLRVEELHAGAGYLDVYDRAGLLRRPALFAHGVQLAGADFARIARTGAGIVHCPTANRFLGAGSFPLAAARATGVPIALGSDVAGGPDRSMVRVARGMLETAGLRRDPPPDAAFAWWLMTAGNAHALGLGDCGVLRPGARADVLVVRPEAGWNASPDPLSYLLYAWDDRWLKAVVLGGRPQAIEPSRPPA